MLTSKLWRVNGRDLFHGLIMVLIGAVLACLEETFSSGSLEVDWKKVGLAAGIAGSSYLLKKFGTKSRIVKKVQP